MRLPTAFAIMCNTIFTIKKDYELHTVMRGFVAFAC